MSLPRSSALPLRTKQNCFGSLNYTPDKESDYEPEPTPSETKANINKSDFELTVKPSRRNATARLGM
jgi:hypothetical protein